MQNTLYFPKFWRKGHWSIRSNTISLESRAPSLLESHRPSSLCVSFALHHCVDGRESYLSPVGGQEQSFLESFPLPAASAQQWMVSATLLLRGPNCLCCSIVPLDMGAEGLGPASDLPLESPGRHSLPTSCHRRFGNTKPARSNSPSPLFSLKRLQRPGPRVPGREVPSAWLLPVLLGLNQEKSLSSPCLMGFIKDGLWGLSASPPNIYIEVLTPHNVTLFGKRACTEVFMLK